MKKSRKILLVVVALVAVLGTAVVLALPRRVPVANAHPNLAALADGQYTGSCENGLVAATVRVTIASGAITQIEVLEHRKGKGQPAEAVLDRVMESQSLAVDAVAGATASSNTLLKAVENALEGEAQ